MFGEQHDQHVSQVWSTSCTVCQTQSQDTVILVESPWWLLGSNLSNLSNLHKTRPMKISKFHCELLKRYLILSHGISWYIIYQCFLHFITDCSLQTCLHHNGRAWDFPRLSWYQTMTQWWSASIAKKMGVLAASSTGSTGSTGFQSTSAVIRCRMASEVGPTLWEDLGRGDDELGKQTPHLQSNEACPACPACPSLIMLNYVKLC